MAVAEVKSDARAWRARADACEDADDLDGAIAVLREAALVGADVLAHIRLAGIYWVQGRFALANASLSDAEQRVTKDDWESHFALHQAYLRGLGTQDPQQKRTLAIEHLIISARETDDPKIWLSLAAHYEGGLNSAPQALDEAERWYARAAATGNCVAVAEYERFRADRLKAISATRRAR
jgi:tetratricopeptide (TPR) repeat protein